jgi:hypothetical protein
MLSGALENPVPRVRWQKKIFFMKGNCLSLRKESHEFKQNSWTFKKKRIVLNSVYLIAF